VLFMVGLYQTSSPEYAWGLAGVAQAVDRA
jgi:hypothetical protein